VLEGLKRYIASLYEMDVDTWQRVIDFIDLTRSVRL
jgi:hypothetical protein